ncbi:hypothetical protein FLK61_33200 [Paenalkalicoccus suaedae]|uniref:YugN-like family protein n=1 Tax=Paenalkalicoccus suaedae TaxID=2592382 RepID=A0A859FEE1_9BACI|nr:YugN family protein [Paenalkalicoccus suaedae]QKS71549.1 hypothetical protein FLK61_33200 [Paenalkalicoccus suaedae]
MKFKENKLEGVIIEFQVLEEIMNESGFDYQFDYERVTFDYKMIDEVKNDTYYFRIPAHVEQGEIPKAGSTVRMMVPYVGKHYYPHGIEYDEEFPTRVLDKCAQKLNLVQGKIEAEKQD